MPLTIFRSHGPSEGPEREARLEPHAAEWDIGPLPEDPEPDLASVISLLVEWNSAEIAAAFDGL